MSVHRIHKVERMVAYSDDEEDDDESCFGDSAPVVRVARPAMLLHISDVKQIAPEQENEHEPPPIISPRSQERRVPLGKSAPNIRAGTVVPTAGDIDLERDARPALTLKQNPPVPEQKEHTTAKTLDTTTVARDSGNAPVMQRLSPTEPQQSQLQQRQRKADIEHSVKTSTPVDNTVMQPTLPIPPQSMNNEVRPMLQPGAPFEPYKIPVMVQEAISNTVVVVSDNFPRLLIEGSVLWKFPFNGRGEAKKRWIRVKTGAHNSGEQTVNVRLPHVDGQGEGHVVSICFPPTICWLDPEKPSDFHNARELAVDAASYVTTGHRTPAFWRMANKRQNPVAAELCFSVVTTERTLDFAADSSELAQQWAAALTLLVGIAGGKYDVSPRAHIQVPPLPLQTGEERRVGTTGTKPDAVAQLQGPLASNSRNTQSTQHAILKLAAVGNANGVLECLMNGCSVDVMDPATGDTALLVACRHGHANIAQICLDYGARNDPHPEFGQTALHAAVSAGHVDCVRAILETASPSGADHVVTNLADSSKQTPLHVACEMGNVACIELLLEHGADMSLRRTDSRNAIHVCCIEGHKAALAVLLSFGGDQWIDETDVDGNTPLHLACTHGHLPCVRLLLETAANPLVINNARLLPYQLASASGHHQVGLLLLEYEPAAAGSRDVLQRRSSCQLRRATSENLVVDVHDRESPWSLPLTRGSSASSIDTALLPRPHSRFSSHSGPASPADFPSPHSFTSSPAFHGKHVHPTVHRQQYSQGWTAASNPTSFGTVATESQATNFPTPSNSSAELQPTSSTSTSSPLDAGQQDMFPEEEDGSLDVAGAQFSAAGRLWTEYYTEENYAYYLCETTGHSQWEDPREHGIVEYTDEDVEAQENKPDGAQSKSTAVDARFQSPNKPKSPHRRPSPRVGRSPNAQMARVERDKATPTALVDLSNTPPANVVKKKLETFSVNTTSPSKMTESMTTAVSPRPGLSALLPSEIVPSSIVTSMDQASAEPKQSAIAQSSQPATAEKLAEDESIMTDNDVSAPPEVAERYLKMARVGVAVPNILAKMTADGCPQSEVDAAEDVLVHIQEASALGRDTNVTTVADPSADSTTGSETTPTQAAAAQPLPKYMKMAKLGVPPLAIIQKMQADECSREEITAVEAALGLPSSQTSPDASPTPKVTAEDLQKDAELAKFVKMVKMGVPPAAAELKMKAEGVSQEKIDGFVAVFDPSRVKNNSPARPSRKNGKTLPTLKVHWNTLPGDKLEKSLWATPRAEQKSQLQAEQIQELTSLFAAKPAARSIATKAVRRGSVAQPQAVDAKRANNVAIGLAQFKAFTSFDQLFELVSSLTINEKLDTEKLENLRPLLPTANEMKLVAGLAENNELHQTEKFFKAAARFPDAAQRVDIALFMDGFEAHHAAVAEQVQRLLDICDRVMNSDHLAQVLQKMLAVGNVMNQGTRQGDASGFTLDSLLRLINTRGVDRKTTVLDYVVRLIHDGSDRELLRLPDDLAGCDAAERDCMGGIIDTITHITAQHDKYATLAQREIERLDFDPSTLSTDESIHLQGDQLYLHRLHVFVASTQAKVDALASQRVNLRSKFDSLAEYFGEDHNCRPEQIFSVLVQFRCAFEQSVQLAERRAKIKKRQQQQQQRHQQQPR